MNDLARANEWNDIMTKALAVSTQDVWDIEPLGHTGFQIRRLILNRSEFPTPDTKRKQIYVELWSRWSAWRSQKYNYARNGIKIKQCLARKEELQGKWFVSRTQKKLNDLEIQSLDLDIAHMTDINRELIIDMEHRIIRETSVFLGELAKLPPSQGAREEIELNNWTEKAKMNQDVARLMRETNPAPKLGKES
jgi:hypothetical protein